MIRTTVTNTATIATIIFLTTTAFLFTPSAITAQLSVPINPETKGGTPPQIAMIYNGKQYFGDLVNYISNSTKSNTTGTTAPIGQSAVTPQNITAPLPSKVVTVKKGSVVNFVLSNGNNTSIKNIPSSMSFTVYNTKGKATGLANTFEHSKTSKFVANLDPGQQYILLSVATWLAQKGSIGTTSAFVSYSFRINVIS